MEQLSPVRRSRLSGVVEPTLTESGDVISDVIPLCTCRADSSILDIRCPKLERLRCLYKQSIAYVNISRRYEDIIDHTLDVMNGSRQDLIKIWGLQGIVDIDQVQTDLRDLKNEIKSNMKWRPIRGHASTERFNEEFPRSDEKQGQEIDSISSSKEHFRKARSLLGLNEETVSLDSTCMNEGEAYHFYLFPLSKQSKVTLCKTVVYFQEEGGKPSDPAGRLDNEKHERLPDTQDDINNDEESASGLNADKAAGIPDTIHDEIVDDEVQDEKFSEQESAKEELELQETSEQDGESREVEQIEIDLLAASEGHKQEEDRLPSDLEGDTEAEKESGTEKTKEVHSSRDEDIKDEQGKIDEESSDQQEFLKEYLQSIFPHLRMSRESSLYYPCEELYSQEDTIAQEDVRLWNRFVSSYRAKPWYLAVWLYTECYLYRRIREALDFGGSLRKADMYAPHKMDIFSKAVPHLLSLAAMTLERFPTIPNEGIEEKKQRLTLMLKLCLYSNNDDLSRGTILDLEKDIIESLNEWEENILIDQSEEIFNQLQTTGLAGPVVIVLDQAGSELFCDFCLADFLVRARLTNRVIFHAKAHPWFITNATQDDVKRMLEDMCNSTHADMVELSQRWKHYFEIDVWKCMTELFWTLPYEYVAMPSIDLRLYCDLSMSSIIIFKGDLNYRKLTADINWPPTTPFSEALGRFRPAPIAAIRRIKSEVVCGLPPGSASKLSSEDDEWMAVGRFGIVQFDNTQMYHEYRFKCACSAEGIKDAGTHILFGPLTCSSDSFLDQWDTHFSCPAV